MYKFCKEELSNGAPFSLRCEGISVIYQPNWQNTSAEDHQLHDEVENVAEQRVLETSKIVDVSQIKALIKSALKSVWNGLLILKTDHASDIWDLF